MHVHTVNAWGRSVGGVFFFICELKKVNMFVPQTRLDSFFFFLSLVMKLVTDISFFYWTKTWLD